MMWTRDEIIEKVAEFEEGIGWYQNIDLAPNLNTKKRILWGEDIDHPRRRWEEVLSGVPEDLTGKSVLDIGCNAGFIAFEAKKRGADYVCGIDYKQEYIDQAIFCNDVLGYDVDFKVHSVYDLDALARQFDIVFFVGVLYHNYHFTSAIDQIVSICNERLILESAVMNKESKIPLVEFVGMFNYDGPESIRAKRLPGHWHPNMTAIKCILHEKGFKNVEKLFKTGGRGGFVATK